jgi:hypothetical protein
VKLKNRIVSWFWFRVAIVCPWCHGNGRFMWREHDGYHRITCDGCQGRGWMWPWRWVVDRVWNWRFNRHTRVQSEPLGDDELPF